MSLLAQLVTVGGMIDCAEIVVVDDSLDGSVSRLLSASSDLLPAQLRVLQTNGGEGVAAARNLGMEAIGTDFVVMCDDDDLVMPGWWRGHQAIVGDSLLWGGPVMRVQVGGELIRHESLLSIFGGPPSPIGANLGLARTLWERMGGFDVEQAHPELDFAWRAVDQGIEVGWASDAWILKRDRVGRGENFVHGLRMARGWQALTQTHPRASEAVASRVRDAGGSVLAARGGVRAREFGLCIGYLLGRIDCRRQRFFRLVGKHV